jgi:hypothetical protein
MTTGMRSAVRSILNLERQRRLLGRRPLFLLWLAGGILLILGWQWAIFTAGYAREADSPFLVTASSGIQDEARFVYFYRFLGLIPVATERPAAQLDYSRDGALNELAEHGSSLRTEVMHTSRYGDLGKVWLFLPDVLLRGFRPQLSVKPANAIAFVLALICVYASACAAGQPVFGLALVLLIGSSPFQVGEVYARDNVFGWPIITLLIAAAINLPLILGTGPRGWKWAAPLMTAFLMGTVRQIRSEPALVCGAVGFVYLWLPKQTWRVRIGLAALLAAAFVAASAGWSAYFTSKFKQADQVVARSGGAVFKGPRSIYHMVWHPIWCGLSDFGAERGYRWDDRAAARYALPILKDRYGIEGVELRGNEWVSAAFWDREHHYYVTPYELPHYNDVLREKVADDVRSHPAWFAGILAKRVWRILTETSPARLAMGRHWMPVPIYGLMLLPVIAVLIWAGSAGPLLVLALSASTSMTAFLVYSGRNTTMYSAYHLVMGALMAAWVIEAVLYWRDRRAGDAALSVSATDTRRSTTAGATQSG